MSKQNTLKFYFRNTDQDSHENSHIELTVASQNKGKYRKYDPLYIGFGFTSIDDCPKCVICLEVLANSAMAPAKLKRHLETRHPQYQNKAKEFFIRKENEMKYQKTVMESLVTENELAVKASFYLSLNIAKSKKNFTIGENLIMPCLVDTCQIMFGDKYAKKIKRIPLSNDTVARRIMTMCSDVEHQLIKLIKKSKIYALQVDESTDIVGKVLLLIYIRYVDWDECEIKEEFLNCLEIKGHATGYEMFTRISEYLLKVGLQLTDCISICTDGAPNMTGKHVGLVAKMKQVASNIKGTRCMIHREILASKHISSDLNQVLGIAVKR